MVFRGHKPKHFFLADRDPHHDPYLVVNPHQENFLDLTLKVLKLTPSNQKIACLVIIGTIIYNR